jgi:uncharacterized protein YbjT (DUF2867 family)
MILTRGQRHRRADQDHKQQVHDSRDGAQSDGRRLVRLRAKRRGCVAQIRVAREPLIAFLREALADHLQGAGLDAAIELGQMHFAVEKAVEDTGIPFTVLRPANFMQNYLNFGTPETIKSQSAFYSPLGDAKMSHIDARDISAVAAKVLLNSGHEGRRYDLTGGESLSNAEIAELFSEALGRPITHVIIPEAAAGEAMAKAGVPPWLIEVLSELNAIARAGSLAPVAPDAELVLQRKPIKFAQFIQDHLAAFKS